MQLTQSHQITSSLGSPQGASETEAAPSVKTEEEVDLPWNVVVLNDPVNLMSYVTMIIRRIFGYSKTKAENMMLEVHHKGRSIVWSGARETAELYVQQLHGQQLMAVIQRVDQ